MKFKTNMWLQFLGVGIQSANFISGALPPKAQAGVSIAVGIAQAIVAGMSHFSNPDGTPATQAFIPPPGPGR